MIQAMTSRFRAPTCDSTPPRIIETSPRKTFAKNCDQVFGLRKFRPKESLNRQLITVSLTLTLEMKDKRVGRHGSPSVSEGVVGR